MRVLLLKALVLIAPYPLLAGDQIENYRLYRSAEYMAKGDTGIAFADNLEAIFYNPAGLAQGKSLYKETVFASPQFEYSKDTSNLIKKIMLEKRNDPETFREHVGKNQHLSFSNFSGIVLRRTALGLYAKTKNNFILKKDPELHGAERVEASSITNFTATLSAADSFFSDKLSLGATLKYLKQIDAQLGVSVLDSANISDQLSDGEIEQIRTGLGLDLGLMFKLPTKAPFQLGVQVENFGDTKLKPEDASKTSKQLKQVWNLGIGYKVESHMSRVLLNLDLRDISSRLSSNWYKRLHLGADIQVGKFIGLATGWNQGYPTAGVYVNLYLTRIDLAMITQEMGSSAGARPDTRYVVRIMVKL